VKHIQSFQSHSQQSIIEDILSLIPVNESSDGVSQSTFSKVLDKVKSISKKGLLTTAMLTALLGKANFSNAQEKQLKQTVGLEQSINKSSEKSPFSSSEYKSNGKFLRITAVGTSGSDYELAHKDADLQASNKLSQQKDELVKRLFVKFEKEVDNKFDYEKNWNKNFPKNFKSENSSGQKEIAQKAYELDNGGYEYWTVKELDLQPLLDHIVNVIDQTEADGKLSEKGREKLYDLVNHLTKGEVEKLDKSNFSDSQSSSKVIKSEITN
jgi:hypothetical protein